MQRRSTIPAYVLHHVQWAVNSLNSANGSIFAERFYCGPYHAELRSRKLADTIRAARHCLQQWRADWIKFFTMSFDDVLAELAQQWENDIDCGMSCGAGLQDMPESGAAPFGIFVR